MPKRVNVNTNYDGIKLAVRSISHRGHTSDIIVSASIVSSCAKPAEHLDAQKECRKCAQILAKPISPIKTIIAHFLPVIRVRISIGDHFFSGIETSKRYFYRRFLAGVFSSEQVHTATLTPITPRAASIPLLWPLNPGDHFLNSISLPGESSFQVKHS